jgi:predicted nucleic acid-binding protein
VIAYFDTSAIVPILIEEVGTDAAGTMWDEADRLVSVRLSRVEARAALAQAHRLGRISSRQFIASKRELDRLVAQLDLVDIDDDLVDRAADLAEQHALRAYDAVHLAAAHRVLDDDLAFVAGDHALLGAAQAIGIAVASIA